jgi:hypothetical protein
MPEPQWHLAVAPALYLATRRVQGDVDPVTAAIASVLIDADHCCDMAYYRLTGDRNRQFVPLHAWEFITLLLLSRSRRVRSIGVGFLAHHVLDLMFGGYGYKDLSFVYRASKRFRTGWLGDWVQWPHGPRGKWQLFYSGTQGHDAPRHGAAASS